MRILFPVMRLEEGHIAGADIVVALDLNTYSLPNLLKDMGPYVTQDDNLITVARGIDPILDFWHRGSDPESTRHRSPHS